MLPFDFMFICISIDRICCVLLISFEVEIVFVYTIGGCVLIISLCVIFVNHCIFHEIISGFTVKFLQNILAKEGWKDCARE